MLALGNSMGDLYANMSIAKIGMGKTGLTACFAGPLFNLLVGLGFSLIISTMDGPKQFHLYSR
jgi:sodium/potassium/calcium exchanger 6